jgi:hypothetical protein
VERVAVALEDLEVLDEHLKRARPPEALDLPVRDQPLAGLERAREVRRSEPDGRQ